MIELRPATDGDRRLLLAIYASARAREVAALPWTEDVAQAFLASQFDAQDAHYRAHYDGASFSVVVVDGEPAGRLYVHRGRAETRLMDITLLPAFRGRGIGTTLLRSLLAERRPITLHVESSNLSARRFYERLGFRAVSVSGAHVLMRASAEDGLVAHAALVGPDRHEEQRELAEGGVVDREGLLRGLRLAGSVEEQLERRAADRRPAAPGRGLAEGQLQGRPLLWRSGEAVADQRTEVVEGQLVEHAATVPEEEAA